MVTAYFVTQSPVPDLYFVARWDVSDDKFLRGVICGVPTHEVNIQAENLNRIIYPIRDNLPVPADELGTIREGDGHIYIKRADSSGLAELTGWRVEKPERSGRNIGWGLLELAFRLAYVFGFAGVHAPFDGLHKKCSSKILHRLTALAARYQGEITQEHTWITIRWAKKPDYRLTLPPEAFVGLPPTNS